MNDFIVDAVIRSVLGGRNKRSKKALKYLTGRRGGSVVNAGRLLTAAGVAWGIYETMQQSPQAAPVSAGAAPLNVTPLPNVNNPDAATRLVWLAVSAANADGAIQETERAAILQHAGADLPGVVAGELERRRPLAEIVAGVSDPVERATLYVLAYTILRADEQVSGAERIYLAQLAHLLRLDPATVQKLEADTAARIDAADQSG